MKIIFPGYVGLFFRHKVFQLSDLLLKESGLCILFRDFSKVQLKESF